jgi:hypothetical protein
MKIEYISIVFQLKKWYHVTSTGVKETKMGSSGFDSLPPILAYIEEYAEKNGFTIVNPAVGNSMQIFLIKQ